jgi:F0F1-type ATP synthase membrane subunit b/b'
LLTINFFTYISLWVSLLGTIGTFIIAYSVLMNLSASIAAKISETRFDYNSDQVDNLSALKADTVIGFSVVGLATIVNFVNIFVDGLVTYEVNEPELLSSIWLVIALFLLLLFIRKVYVKKFNRKILIEVS